MQKISYSTAMDIAVNFLIVLDMLELSTVDNFRASWIVKYFKAKGVVSDEY